MRHGKRFNHLSRKSAHRKAMLANMASSLIEHKRIKTTLAKAKALRSYIEPLITKSKNDTTHSRRVVFSYLKQNPTLSSNHAFLAKGHGGKPLKCSLATSKAVFDHACVSEIIDCSSSKLGNIIASKLYYRTFCSFSPV